LLASCPSPRHESSQCESSLANRRSSSPFLHLFIPCSLSWRGHYSILPFHLPDQDPVNTLKNYNPSTATLASPTSRAPSKPHFFSIFFHPTTYFSFLHFINPASSPSGSGDQHCALASIFIQLHLEIGMPIFFFFTDADCSIVLFKLSQHC
jgi:hypothetical protein